MSRAAPTDRAKENAKLKFRILCKRCNSYLFTKVAAYATAASPAGYAFEITCSKCGNEATSFEDEIR